METTKQTLASASRRSRADRRRELWGAADARLPL